MTMTTLAGDRIRTIYVKAASQDKIASAITQITSILAQRHDVEVAKPDLPYRPSKISSRHRKLPPKPSVTCWPG